MSGARDAAAMGRAPSGRPIGEEAASDRRLVWVALGAVWLSVGGNYLAFKFALASMPPILMVSARLLIAGLLLLPFGAARADWRLPSRAEWRVTCVSAVLLLVIGQGAIVWGIQYLPAGTTAVLASSAPIWLALFAAVFLRAPLDRRAMVGVGLGAAGLALLSWPSGGGNFDPVGSLAVLGGAAGWALGSLYAGRAKLTLDPVLAVSLQMLVGGAILLAAALATGEAATLDIRAIEQPSWLAFAYLVLIGSIVGYGLFVWLNATADAVVANTHHYVAPVIALALSAVLLAEPITAAKVGAAILALAGAAMMAGHHARTTQQPTRPDAARACTQ